MSRAVDLIVKNSQAEGYDMVTQAHKTFTHPSLAEGTWVIGLSDGSTATGSPGAVLGTGSNVDLYTPGIEAV